MQMQTNCQQQQQLVPLQHSQLTAAVGLSTAISDGGLHCCSRPAWQSANSMLNNMCGPMQQQQQQKMLLLLLLLA
jgi:hypothetical protein